MKKFKMRKRPKRPDREIKKFAWEIDAGESLAGLVQWFEEICPSKDYKECIIEGDYWYDHQTYTFVFERLETDEEYEESLKKYEESLQNYEAWHTKHKSEIKNRLDKTKRTQLERLRLKKRKLEKDLEKLNVSLEEL